MPAVLEVSQLVHEHVVEERDGRLDDAPVDAQDPAPIATPPALGLLPYGDACLLDPQATTDLSETAGKVRVRVVPQRSRQPSPHLPTTGCIGETRRDPYLVPACPDAGVLVRESFDDPQPVLPAEVAHRFLHDLPIADDKKATETVRKP